MKPRINNMSFKTLENVIDFIIIHNFFQEDCRVVIFSWKDYWNDETLRTVYTIKLKQYYTKNKDEIKNHLTKDLLKYRTKINTLFDWNYNISLNINTVYRLEM